MRTIEKRSIGGYVFSLETDACGKINEYLDDLNEYYSKQESGKEVMDGIEERLAELLLEKCGQNGIVTTANVNDVISVLGRPETIEEESSDSSEPGNESSPVDSGVKAKKRLYRDKANGRIAGVCSGLGAYFDVDPTIFRLAFVAGSILMIFFYNIFARFFMYRFEETFYLFFPLIYVVLWICMPVAKTVRQKDELHGESGTVDAISERVQRSHSNPSEQKRYDSWPKIERVFVICLGVIFMIAGVCGISAIGAVLVRHDYLYFKISEYLNFDPDIIRMFGDSVSVWLLALACVVPFLLLLYWGVLMCFGLKSPKWKPDLILFILWLAFLTALAVYTAIYLADYM